MNAILKLKDRKIDRHIKNFAENGAEVEVIRYTSPNWVTIRTFFHNHDFIIDVPSDVLDIKKCDDCEEKNPIVGYTFCKKCGTSDY